MKCQFDCMVKCQNAKLIKQQVTQHEKLTKRLTEKGQVDKEGSLQMAIWRHDTQHNNT
jgi:hypothetical protein